MFLSKFGVPNLLGTWANVLGAADQRQILVRRSFSHIYLTKRWEMAGWSWLLLLFLFSLLVWSGFVSLYHGLVAGLVSVAGISTRAYGLHSSVWTGAVDMRFPVVFVHGSPMSIVWDWLVWQSIWELGAGVRMNVLVLADGVAFSGFVLSCRPTNWLVCEDMIRCLPGILKCEISSLFFTHARFLLPISTIGISRGLTSTSCGVRPCQPNSIPR